MTKAKQQATLELAYDLVQKIHHDLCLDKKTELAEQTLEIQKRIIMLSQELRKADKAQRSSFEIPKETLAAINAIGCKTHREV